ncbi:HD domain-containing protein [Marinobacterium jannaschii]|uniref:HD domain-containing protein n=1 Tax=Marinobacterium jannaschii TaxID=64970 RepID=UPI000563386E|nr:HD domain-containing protein [Marinobacterium jannaschii]
MTTIIDQIEQLYADKGCGQYGEAISQLQHALQCAELARQAQASDEMVAAALLHDIGHLLEDSDSEFGNVDADRIGARFLAPYFSKQVCEPIRLHARAKRYLCSVEEHYFATLSAASRYSLKLQGGLLEQDEIEDFRAEPFFPLAIKLRRWVEESKQPGLDAGCFSDYRAALQQAML